MTAPISNEPTTTRLHHYAGRYFGEKQPWGGDTLRGLSPLTGRANYAPCDLQSGAMGVLHYTKPSDGVSPACRTPMVVIPPRQQEETRQLYASCLPPHAPKTAITPATGAAGAAAPGLW